MYKVLVADDEPLSIQTICSIIQKKTKDFEVIATASDGESALDLIRKNRSELDLVISDIRMPRPNGLELAQIVREEMPDLHFLIISGYAEFSFAQSAIRSGVMDYLLKPVTPSKLVQSLDYARVRIEQTWYHKRNHVLKELCSGENISPKELEKYFLYDRYYLALIRRNGLPSRYRAGKTMEIFSDIEEQYLTFGRDEMEALYLLPENLPPQDFKELIRHMKMRQAEEGDYLTCVYYRIPARREELGEKIQNLYQNLNLFSRVGVSQDIELDQIDEQQKYDRFSLRELDNPIQQIRNYASSHNYKELRKEIMKVFSFLIRKEARQLEMEQMTREIIRNLQRYGAYPWNTNESEYLMADVFYTVRNTNELIESLIQILIREEEPEKSVTKIDSLEFYQKIENYLKNHLRDELSMQKICQIFGISQPYMSKLFRKYSTMSFNQYLTRLRMEKARTIMVEDKTYFIKDIAELVGYQDQFYFSRIFRAYFGKSPSEYMKEIEENNQIFGK